MYGILPVYTGLRDHFLSIPLDWDCKRPKGHVTQQQSNDQSEQNHKWKQHWLHVDFWWQLVDTPTHSNSESQRETTTESRVGRWMAPLLPKVILTGCGVCSSLVPCHIFPSSLRSKTIDSLLITQFVFNAQIRWYLRECHWTGDLS